MSEAIGAERQRRVGLLGSLPDPAAQLLEEVEGFAGADFLVVTNPAGDAALVDEILVLGQNHALAHFADLLGLEIPCRILLRRRGPAEQELEWQSGIAWLSQCLEQAGRPDIGLLALTPAAGEALSSTLGEPVTALEPLRRIATERPIVRLARNTETIEFATLTTPPETRRCRLDTYNWVRLRRLARLESADPDDLDMGDLVALANGAAEPATVPAQPAKPPCLIAVVPNGVGLGHVTRMMAIAAALRESANARLVFWSFSRAAEILQGAGYEVVLRQTAGHLDAHPPHWRDWETLEFARAVRYLQPQAVTYDGMTFDTFIVDALKTVGAGRTGVVWVRRGMLQPDANAELLESEQYCDVVLEPGDLSVANDKGPTRMRRPQNMGFSSRIEAPPVTLKPYLPAYDAKTARRRLGLGWGRHCLVSLGGAFGNWDGLRETIIARARANGVKLVWAQSPLAGAGGQVLADTIVKRFYPLSRYLSAFDGMITATGYNSYHELMLGYDGPVLLAPTNHERLDDQVARASHAGDQGWASVIYADRAEEQAKVIDDFMRQVRARAKITTRPSGFHGAPELAAAILSVCDRYRGDV